MVLCVIFFVVVLVFVNSCTSPLAPPSRPTFFALPLLLDACTGFVLAACGKLEAHLQGRPVSPDYLESQSPESSRSTPGKSHQNSTASLMGQHNFEPLATSTSATPAKKQQQQQQQQQQPPQAVDDQGAISSV